MGKLNALIEEAAAAGVFPLARGCVFVRGHQVWEGGNTPADTVFDLASLTKVMATTALALQLKVDLKAPLKNFLPTARAGHATLEELLFHRAGLVAFLPFFAKTMTAIPQLFDDDCPPGLRAAGRRHVVDQVLATPPIRGVGDSSVYSDLGFILLGEALAAAGGAPLDAMFAERIATPLGIAAHYRRISSAPAVPSSLAPTGNARPREPAVGQEGMWTVPARPTRAGEVDDDNAWCLDGVSGHAGLFGTASDVARFGQAVLDGTFVPPTPWGRDPLLPSSTRALGFDTPSDEAASAGQRFGRAGPKGAIGHLGFTGTSLWIDLDRQLVVALCTNRVALGRANIAIRDFRPRFHDAVLDALSPKSPMTDDGNVLSTIDPSSIRRIHLVGVAGTGMGSFAGMLKAAGYEVTGSDENVYPPMSDMLKTWGIPALTPYAPQNLEQTRPDLVIIGNVIRRVNVEATAARESGVKQMSFPAALGSLFLKQRHTVVVAGTHGKTTTSSLMGHVLASAGRDPTFLVGGVTNNYAGNYRLGKGPHFVVEGDEYDTAYFDKGPKFLHYQPRTVILTSVEFDHADIYRDLAHYESSFQKLMTIIPKDGLLAVSTAYPNAIALAKSCAANVVTYRGQEGAVADYAPGDLRFSEAGAHFTVLERGAVLGPVHLPMGGAHNVENALGVIAAARGLGLSHAEIATGLAGFSGVKRRQEVRGEKRGVLVIDDFAHHPTAVRETIAAVKGRTPGRRLWAIFEPRSNTSRRNIHQEDYAHSFVGADRASIKVADPHDKIPAGEGLDVPLLAKALTAQGIPSFAAPSVDALLDEVIAGATAGDVLLVMSNGSFGGFIDKLLARL